MGGLLAGRSAFLCEA